MCNTTAFDWCDDVGDRVPESQDAFWTKAVNDILIVAVTDPNGRIIHVNDRFCSISGYGRDELIGQDHRILNSGTHDAAFFADMFRTIRRGATWRGEICNRAKDGSLYWVATTIIPETDRNSRIIRYVACRFDITEQKAAQQRLKELATRDALTGLLNRHGLESQLSEVLIKAGNTGRAIHVIMLDIDHFKDVNDVNGHDIGDRVLCAIGKRLAASVGRHGFAARLGGDEIAIVLECDSGMATAETLVEQMRMAIRSPIDLGPCSISVTASFGMACFPVDGQMAGDLIKRADIALYRAKRHGRDRYELFEPEMLNRNMRRIALQEQAAIGITRDEFELFYQPIIATDGISVPCCEALLRWRHPAMGLLSPGAFQEVLDSPRLMKPIGEFVQRQIIRQAAEWISTGVPFGKIKYNTSSADFDQPGYALRLLSRLSEAGVPVDRIGIEVTEGMFLGHRSNTVRHELGILNESGIETAFDDFGTGFASLTHLRDLPINRLKIDRSFVVNLGCSERNETIVCSIVRLAQSLSLSITAEGVETTGQLGALVRLGCDHIQGYYLSRPLAALEIVQYLYRFASTPDIEKKPGPGTKLDIYLTKINFQ